jgi:hypothetical protein
LAICDSAKDSEVFKIFSFIFLSGLWLSSFPAQSSDEIRPTTTPETPSKEDVMIKLNALRDRFISTIKADGFRTRLPAPTIVLDNPPSYGNFEEDKNLLHIAVWAALTEQQQSRFEHVSKLIENGKSGEQTFEESVHHWVFVHELGHWWQACQHKISNNHYSVEYGANRLAAAYWRQTDPDLMRRTENRMATVIRTIQSPLPEGQIKETYFNDNYERLGPTPGYIWFQYTMVLSVQGERPLPSFKQTLAQPIFPE